MVEKTATVSAATVFGLLSKIKKLLSDFHPEIYRTSIRSDLMEKKLEFSIHIPKSKIDRAGSAVKLEIPEEYDIEYLRKDDQMVCMNPSPVAPPSDGTYEWKIPAPDPGEYTLVVRGDITKEQLETIINTRLKEERTIRTKYVNKISFRYTPMSNVETLIEDYTVTADFDDRYLLTEVRDMVDTAIEEGEQSSEEWSRDYNGDRAFIVNNVEGDDESDLEEILGEVRKRVNQGFIQGHIQVSGNHFTYENIDFEWNELDLPKSFSVIVVADFENDVVNTTEKVVFEKERFWKNINIEFDILN